MTGAIENLIAKLARVTVPPYVRADGTKVDGYSYSTRASPPKAKRDIHSVPEDYDAPIDMDKQEFGRSAADILGEVLDSWNLSPTEHGKAYKQGRAISYEPGESEAHYKARLVKALTRYQKAPKVKRSPKRNSSLSTPTSEWGPDPKSESIIARRMYVSPGGTKFTVRVRKINPMTISSESKFYGSKYTVESSVANSSRYGTSMWGTVAYAKTIAQAKSLAEEHATTGSIER